MRRDYSGNRVWHHQAQHGWLEKFDRLNLKLRGLWFSLGQQHIMLFVVISQVIFGTLALLFGFC